MNNKLPRNRALLVAGMGIMLVLVGLIEVITQSGGSGESPIFGTVMIISGIPVIFYGLLNLKNQ